jgi:hypothetical protein
MKEVQRKLVGMVSKLVTAATISNDIQFSKKLDDIVNKSALVSPGHIAKMDLNQVKDVYTKLKSLADQYRVKI